MCLMKLTHCSGSAALQEDLTRGKSSDWCLGALPRVEFFYDNFNLQTIGICHEENEYYRNQRVLGWNIGSEHTVRSSDHLRLEYRSKLCLV